MNFEDDIFDISQNELKIENDGLKNYKAKAKYYICEHQYNEAIKKLKSNILFSHSDIEVLEKVIWLDFGIKEEEFKEKVAKIAELAVGDACTGSNPRPIDPAAMEKLFNCTYYGTEVDF